MLEKAKVEVVGFVSSERIRGNTLATSGAKAVFFPSTLYSKVPRVPIIFTVTYDEIAELLNRSGACSRASVEAQRYRGYSILRLPFSLLNMGLEWYPFFSHES